MTEHVHEWADEYDGYVGWFVCKECGEQLHLCDAVARLNATERLSAEMARRCLDWPGQVFDAEAYKALRAYADALAR